MDPIIDLIETSRTRQDYAKVILVSGRLYSVETETGVYQLKRAASCLIEPRVDDLVLASIDSSEKGFVLAVLERGPGNGATLLFDGDVDIKSEGRVGITSKKTLELASHESISITSVSITMAASESTMNIGRLSFWGNVIEAHLGRIRTVIDTIDSFVKRFFQKCGLSFRFIEEDDHVRSNHIDYQAEKTLRLRGTFAQMTAKEDIHIDGERINIG